MLKVVRVCAVLNEIPAPMSRASGSSIPGTGRIVYTEEPFFDFYTCPIIFTRVICRKRAEVRSASSNQPAVRK